MKSILKIIGALIITSISTGALAAPAKTVCPRFIAEKIGDVYYPRENFLCFSSTREAEKAGFSTIRSLSNPNYTGWWRWNLTLSANSCGGPTRGASATTYFLQLKQDSTSGLFGSLCPGGDTFVGAMPVRDPTLGFSIVSTSRTSQDDFCNGGPASVSYIFEARDFDGLFSAAKTAKLTQVKVCELDNTKRCRAAWTGPGGRETTDHRFWPQVSNDISQLNNNCSIALSTCQGCHAAPQP